MDNKVMMQYFEWYLPSDKTLWRNVKKDAAYLKKLGITEVWLPPAYKGASGVTDVGYSVYDLYDLGEFYQKGSLETKYGSKDEYLEAINELHKNNIKVYADTVLGHRTGADELEKTYAVKDDPYNRNETIGKKRKVQVWTKFNFWARNGKYSNFKWNWTNFHGVDYDELNHENGIFRFIDKEWDKDVDKELGNYDYLLGADVDMDDEEVIEELNNWGKWYLDFTGIDGFRLDAVKHIKFSFYNDWIKNMRKHSDKELYAVAEYWSGNLEALKNYISKTSRQIKVFDVPLHYNMFKATKDFDNFDMRTIFDGTVVKEDEEMAVTFVDNHDSQYGQGLESWIGENFKDMAYALILLRKGGDPCIFYGDLYGVKCQNINKTRHLEELLRVRRLYAYGKEEDYFDDKNVIGWTRLGDNEHEGSAVAVIMSNGKEKSSKKMFIGSKFAGNIFYDYLGNVEETVTIDKEGYGIFNVNEKSLSVWVRK